MIGVLSYLIWRKSKYGNALTLAGFMTKKDSLTDAKFNNSKVEINHLEKELRDGAKTQTVIKNKSNIKPTTKKTVKTKTTNNKKWF